jgi:protein-disulfide isomerase
VTAEELARPAGVDPRKLRDCVESDRARGAVLGDLSAGWALNVHGTPTFVVDGEVYPGAVPAEVLQRKLGLPAPPKEAP